MERSLEAVCLRADPSYDMVHRMPRGSTEENTGAHGCKEGGDVIECNRMDQQHSFLCSIPDLFLRNDGIITLMISLKKDGVIWWSKGMIMDIDIIQYRLYTILQMFRCLGYWMPSIVPWGNLPLGTAPDALSVGPKRFPGPPGGGMYAHHGPRTCIPPWLSHVKCNYHICSLGQDQEGCSDARSRCSS